MDNILENALENVRKEREEKEKIFLEDFDKINEINELGEIIHKCFFNSIESEMNTRYIDVHLQNEPYYEDVKEYSVKNITELFLELKNETNLNEEQRNEKMQLLKKLIKPHYIETMNPFPKNILRIGSFGPLYLKNQK
jgi:hypothetical protein